jgi:hypothetical protein
VLDIIPSEIETHEEHTVKNKLNLDEIQCMDDNTPLHGFLFRVSNQTSTFVISFKLIHNM